MIEWIFKIVLIAVFVLIFRQDVKDRLVYWFLYPMAGSLGFAAYAIAVGILPALVSALVNLILVSLVILIAYAYTRWVSKKRFLNESIGSGDLLLFICLPFAFSTMAFTVLFVFSLLFALILQGLRIQKGLHATVPLAGYMSLFFASVYLISFFIQPKYLYSY